MTTQQQEFQQRIGKIEELVHQIEHIADPTLKAAATELVQTLLELHGAGLERMLEITHQTGAAGQSIIDTMGQDDLVSSLLILHGLHPLDLETRVRQALDKVRPYLGSHGGNVELLDVSAEGQVSLRLEGSCHGCPSSQVTLKYAIEEEIYKAAPDVTAIQVEGAVANPPAGPANFVPMTQLTTDGEHSNNGWVPVAGAASLTEGNVRIIDISGQPALFCRVGQSLYAYHHTCPHCNQLLGQATLAGPALTCPGCGHSYDVMRAGRSLDAPHLHLEPFPLLQEHGQVKVALPAPHFGG